MDPFNISKEFIEKAIGMKISSFSIKSGANVGDNYMSVLYSIVVKLESGEEVSLISKCYPMHQARQELLNKSNLFWNELSIYRDFLPSVKKMCDKAGLDVRLPFPKYVGGAAVNFRGHASRCNNVIEKIYEPFDNFIVMEDMRASGYSLAGRHLGLDLDHVRLVVNEYAKLHALFWAYKQLNELETLASEFPFLEYEMPQEYFDIFNAVLEGSIKTAVESIEFILGKDTQAAIGTQKLAKEKTLLILKTSYSQTGSEQEFSKIIRIQPEEHPNEIAWKVLIHGDSWTNNFLFQYNEVTKKPSEVVLVDLQHMREHCPTTDLAYLIYSSTTSELRKDHLNDLLSLYYSKFSEYCSKLSVKPLPGFTLDELKRRFHRTKIFGYLLALAVIPIMLKDSKDIKDPEQAGDSLTDVFAGMSDMPIGENEYSNRISSLAQELYEDGII